MKRHILKKWDPLNGYMTAVYIREFPRYVIVKVYTSPVGLKSPEEARGKMKLEVKRFYGKAFLSALTGAITLLGKSESWKYERGANHVSQNQTT